MKNNINRKSKNKGFGMIEILVSIAILAIVFSFIFYFVYSINLKNNTQNQKPYLLNQYNYSDKYCYLENGQIENLSILQSIDMSSYISTSTIITSINIFHKNRLIITTDSASTTESDIFLFDFIVQDGHIDIGLIKSINTGPGVNDALLHDNFFYTLNSSVNSHIKTFKINMIDDTLTLVSGVSIQKLFSSYSMPKKIYLYNKTLLVGSEKNNSGEELFVLPLDVNNKPIVPVKSIEIGGQVNSFYINQGLMYVANASDVELFIYDKDFNLIGSYDAPLSLGNGKSVYYLDPYIYLGRTVSSFELFLLEMKEGIVNFFDKYHTYGSMDFIQNINQYLLIFTNSQNKELQFLSKEATLVKSIDLPSRANSYTCFENSLLTAHIINNQSNILWIK